jgi:hypothetical protein
VVGPPLDVVGEDDEELDEPGAAAVDGARAAVTGACLALAAVDEVVAPAPTSTGFPLPLPPLTSENTRNSSAQPPRKYRSALTR